MCQMRQCTPTVYPGATRGTGSVLVATDSTTVVPAGGISPKKLLGTCTVTVVLAASTQLLGSAITRLRLVA